MNLQPLGNRIFVKPFTKEETTASGIVLPDTVEKEKKAEGEVVALGQGEKVTKLNLKVGDKVLFGQYAGENVEFESTDYKFLKDDEILAVVK